MLNFYLKLGEFGEELNMLKEVTDSFKAFLIENAELTDIEGYPKIRENMISTFLPSNIITFKESLKVPKDKRKDYYVCTYAPDKTFMRVLNNPQRYIEYFQQFAGIIGFDFSVHSDMPPVVQKQQMNNNLSLTYFYGNNSIKTIPNIRTGSNYISQEFYDALPKHTLVAVGTHGFIKNNTQKYEWYYCLREIIEKLNPSGIVVYGTLRGKLFDRIKEMVPVYQYDSWADKKYKKEKAARNGDKRT